MFPREFPIWISEKQKSTQQPLKHFREISKSIILDISARVRTGGLQKAGNTSVLIELEAINK